jgi:hypothetical protein
VSAAVALVLVIVGLAAAALPAVRVAGIAPGEVLAEPDA